MIPKQSAYDTKFTARTADGNDIREFRVPLGTGLVVNVPALHYNRKRRRVSDRTGRCINFCSLQLNIGKIHMNSDLNVSSRSGISMHGFLSLRGLEHA